MNPFLHKKIDRSDSAGFTLMELIVVLGIFTTVVVAASDIFLLSASAQRKIFGLERTQSDARFTMEALAREFRAGEVDYAYYESRVDPMEAPDDELALIDSNNVKVRFFRTSDPDICADEKSSPCLAVKVGDNDSASMTPRNVVVRNAQFYISPMLDPTDFDPATGLYEANEQQMVTVILALESVLAKANENVLVSFQTTIANRVYRR